MRCCPRSPFLSPLWAEMPYHRFGNSVVQHRAHPVETLRRMARRHSRPSPRPYMRTGRSGVRPDGVFHLGRHRHSRHAVKARRIVRTEVRAAVTQLFRATCCRLRYWDTASELCSLPCRPWPCLPKDEVPQALRFSWLSILGLHWEDFRRITREIPGI